MGERPIFSGQSVSFFDFKMRPLSFDSAFSSAQDVQEAQASGGERGADVRCSTCVRRMQAIFRTIVLYLGVSEEAEPGTN
jgi:hypothetical protein